jgi:hypothetical protein
MAERCSVLTGKGEKSALGIDRTGAAGTLRASLGFKASSESGFGPNGLIPQRFSKVSSYEFIARFRNFIFLTINTTILNK